MRLTKKNIQKHKENIYNIECIRGKVKISDDNIIHNLYDTIEALRLENIEWQENYEELDAGHSKLYKAYCEIKQENEQLQAQVAQYREALIIANHRMPDAGQFCACGNCKICGATISYAGYEYCISCARVIIDEALSTTPADYHNPADVAEIELLKIARDNWKKTAGILDDALKKERAALEKAREALELSKIHTASCFVSVHRKIDGAITAIDKIGGREDE